MAKLTRKETQALLRQKLKGNPRALAELEFREYQDNTEWYLKQSKKEAGKITRLNKYFLRGK